MYMSTSKHMILFKNKSFWVREWVRERGDEESCFQFETSTSEWTLRRSEYWTPLWPGPPLSDHLTPHQEGFEIIRPSLAILAWAWATLLALNHRCPGCSHIPQPQSTLDLPSDRACYHGPCQSWLLSLGLSLKGRKKSCPSIYSQFPGLGQELGKTQRGGDWALVGQWLSHTPTVAAGSRRGPWNLCVMRARVSAPASVPINHPGHQPHRNPLCFEFLFTPTKHLMMFSFLGTPLVGNYPPHDAVILYLQSRGGLHR